MFFFKIDFIILSQLLAEVYLMHAKINDRYSILYAGTSGVLLGDIILQDCTFSVFFVILCDMKKKIFRNWSALLWQTCFKWLYWLFKLFSMLHFVLAAWAKVLCNIWSVIVSDEDDCVTLAFYALLFLNNYRLYAVLHAIIFRCDRLARTEALSRLWKNIYHST